MQIITDTDGLRKLCERLATGDYITIDTEFVRERTYWPVLCLIQVANDDEAAIIDPLAKGISLDPLLELLADEDVVKVFHAAGQDLEIFCKLMGGKLPAPVFDTQIAGMVTGFGDQIGYDRLVEQVCGVSISKASRFTDWARRPLSKQQLDYALGDVTHLRDIYKHLIERLIATKRGPWLDEEMEKLLDPGTYITEPDEAWQKVKFRRPQKPKFLAVLKAIAAWREQAAQERDIPRGRMLKDDVLIGIANQPPKDEKGLEQVRGISEGFARGKMGKELMEAIRKGLDMPKEDVPSLPKGKRPRNVDDTVRAMLRAVLRHCCEEHDVASRLVASAADLEDLASGRPEKDNKALSGWRYEIFGRHAEALLNGKMALAVEKGQPILREL